MAERPRSDTCENERVECWSDLPVELLQNIVKRLDAKVDVSRSRAVCKSWRFSIPPLNGNSPPIKVHFSYTIRRRERRIKKTILPLRMRVVYHVAPQSPASNSRGWLVKVTESEKTWQKPLIMLHPLSGSPFPKGLVPNPLLPKELNLNDFRVSELSKTYHSPCAYQLAVCFNSDFPALTMIGGGKLYHCKLEVDGESPKCKEIKSLTSSVNYEDVICHEGKFYVVSLDGRTIVVVKGELNLQFVPSLEQFADIFTKGLSTAHFEYLCCNLVLGNPSTSLRGAVKIIELSELGKNADSYLGKQETDAISGKNSSA